MTLFISKPYRVLLVLLAAYAAASDTACDADDVGLLQNHAKPQEDKPQKNQNPQDIQALGNMVEKLTHKIEELTSEVKKVAEAGAKHADLLSDMTSDMSKEKLDSLTHLAEALAQAKRNCRVKQSPECLSLLQDVKKRMWPYVQGELAETNAKLPKEPHKMNEDDSHRPDIYRAELKEDVCGKPMYFVDLTESNSEGMLQDLAMVSDGRLKLQPKESKAANCQELVPEDSPEYEHDSTFVLVRNPLERFISGYAAIERSLRQTTSSKEAYSFLNKAKSNGTERARLFLDRFFEDGANYSSHVSSMAEYVGGMAKSCQRLPSKYFAKVEHARMNWKTFLKRMQCEEVFNKTADSFELMSKPGDFKHSMNDALRQHEPPYVPSDKTLWDATTPAKLLQLEATESSVAGASHMMGALGLNNFVYLRAFCWLNLPDFVMFEYDLPLACHREDMDVILKLTEQKVQSIRAAEQKENASDKSNDGKQKDGKQKDGKDGKQKKEVNYNDLVKNF